MPQTVYQFHVEGELPEHARAVLCDTLVEKAPAGVVLYAAVIDESHLYGIIAQFRALGLSVVSVHPLVSAQPAD